MPSRFEQILVFCVISVLVGLFAWITCAIGNEDQACGCCGWIAILVHFAVPLAGYLDSGLVSCFSEYGLTELL